MKKNRLIILLTLMLFLTGCTKVLKDDENKIVKNSRTSQNVTKNILCQPRTKESLKIYENNNKLINAKLEDKELDSKKIDDLKNELVDIEKLPKCNEFEINSGGYDGLWDSLFVKPLAWLILTIGKLVNNYGISVIIVTLLMRTIVFPFTKNMTAQSENMKKARPELEKLEKKYKNKDQKEVAMQKTQEMMMIYKKYNIKPMSSCLTAFIQIPLFFGFYEAMNRLPALFESKLLVFDLGLTPSAAFKTGNYIYMIIVILIILVTYYSFKINSQNSASVSVEQEKQMKLMSNIMIVFISIASFTLPVGLGIYWISNSTFTILQNIIVKRSK